MQTGSGWRAGVARKYHQRPGRIVPNVGTGIMDRRNEILGNALPIRRVAEHLRRQGPLFGIRRVLQNLSQNSQNEVLRA